MNEQQWVVVTIGSNDVVHTWGPYASAHDARQQANQFRRERRAIHAPDARFVVCQVLAVQP